MPIVNLKDINTNLFSIAKGSGVPLRFNKRDVVKRYFTTGQPAQLVIEFASYVRDPEIRISLSDLRIGSSSTAPVSVNAAESSLDSLFLNAGGTASPTDAVLKTGDQSIDGEKTFTEKIIIGDNGGDSLTTSFQVFSKATGDDGISVVNINGNPNGAVFNLYKKGTAGGRLGEFHFFGDNLSGDQVQMAAIYSDAQNTTTGSESGNLLMNATHAGVAVPFFEANGESDLVQFNQGFGTPTGWDFRCQATGRPNAFFVKGSSGNVGINTGTPDVDLKVIGIVDIGYSATAVLRMLHTGAKAKLQSYTNGVPSAISLSENGGGVEIYGETIINTSSAPATPASGSVVEWFDGTNKRWKKSDGTTGIIY
jgi:hypothetical protein